MLTILDMAPRDCHITTLHIASRCSDGFTAAAPALGELPSCCSQTQALAGNQLALPLRRAKGEGLEKLGETWIQTDLYLLPALALVPLSTASLCPPGQLCRSHPALAALHEFLASSATGCPTPWWVLAPRLKSHPCWWIQPSRGSKTGSSPGCPVMQVTYMGQVRDGP